MAYETETPAQVESLGFKHRMRVAARQVWNNTKARYSLLTIGTLFFLSVFGIYLVPTDPYSTNPDFPYMAPLEGGFILGTDHHGRDLLARVLLGGRTTLYLGVAAAGLGLLGGIPLGLTAGMVGGKTDEFLMRLSDIMLSFPTLILALLIIAVLGSSLNNAILAIGIVYMPRVARVVRGSTLSVKEEEFVKAAEANGESTVSIMFREILPNITGPIFVEGSIRVGFAILVGASLSFLGLGAQPPYPDWGYMIASSRDHIYNTPWFLIWPSMALGLTIIAFNMLGDALRDVLDPHSRHGE